jgi:hypothetical protein
MKNLLTLVVLGISCCCYSQTSNSLNFDYDNAGNQTVRELEICIGCRSKAPSQSTDQNYVQSEEFDEISYYPNPVLEQLSLKWVNSSDRYVKNVNIYSVSGQLMSELNDLNEKETTTAEFSQFAEGLYVVTLNYNNGEQKTLKVVKKK